MTTVIGVDVGNSTTEAVLVESRLGSPPRVLAHDRSPTRGVKGTVDSLRGAAALVRRLQRTSGHRADLVAIAALRPVRTGAVALTPRAVASGRLEALPTPGDTPGTQGLGVGGPRWVTDPPEASRPVILLARAGTGYAATAAAVRRWDAAGADVRGVLLADDEAVLVSARIAPRVPVADLVDVTRASTAELLAMEVRAPGHALRDLGDPIRLGALLGLGEQERDDLVSVVAAVGDAARAVVALHDHSPPDDAREPSCARVWTGADLEPASLTPAIVRSGGVGHVRRWSAEGTTTIDVDDLWAVGLRDVATSVGAAVDASTSRDVVVAALHTDSGDASPSTVLADELDQPVRLVHREARAARAGAMTTPGVRPGALVADLGGGSIDVISADGRETVAAGAGELVTLAVARFLELPLGAADFVKRGPSARLESPQLVLAEDGSRQLLDRPADAATVGQLTVEGPVGRLAFGGGLAPSEWRALRRGVKRCVLVDNLVRTMRTADPETSGRDLDLLLVGGVAGDEELLGLMRESIPGVVVGRANIPDLGHRYAVAFGLAVLAVEEAP